MILCALVLSTVALLPAQTPGTTLRGTVLDPSGLPVPKASVTVSGPNNVVKVVQTDASGVYTVAGLAPGKYMVRVIAAGFSLFEKAGVDVAARPVTLDAHLAIATETQEVTVADTQQVELDPSRNAGALVLKEADMDMLPDDPDDLQADLLALAGPAAGPNGGQMYIDGFSNGQLPPKESIREIRINSNPFSSEFDAPGYGRIEILTKPGSDKFRGMVQFNYGNSIWNARNPYSPDKPYYDTNNLNANLSGPILKNKMSFFIDFARRDMRDSDLINAQLSPSLNFAQSVIAPSERTNISPRIDYQLTPNITLQGRYSWVQQTQANQGIGGINLAAGTVLPPCGTDSSIACYVPPNTSTAYSQTSTNQTVQLTETQVINATTINETRFQYFRQRQNQTGDNPILNVQVNDEFAFGSNFPLQYTNQDNYELQNYTSITHGTQFIKFGARLREGTQASYYTTNFTGQYIFDSLAAYQAGTPAQYIIAGGTPLQDVKQFDAGLFVQDDWKVKPSLTISLGARYEIQQNMSDYGDFAPRIGLAWGLGPGQGRLRQPQTVLRAGYGWFYTRFPLGDTLNDQRFNGLNQVTYNVNSPQFLTAGALQQMGYSAATANALGMPIPSLAQFAESSSTYHTDSNLRSPVIYQTALGVDRSLPRGMTLSVNYINSRGNHQLQTVDINAPLPGTYIPTAALAANGGVQTAIYPLGAAAGVYNLYQSGGIFKQNQLILNMRVPFNRFSLQGYYAYGHADASAANPSNPYNFSQDYGRAPYDYHHRVQIEGTIVLPWKLRLNPNISYQSAAPFNITEGIDQYGTTSTGNARPAFAPAGYAGPCYNANLDSQALNKALASNGTACAITTFGNLIINPGPGLKPIPINLGDAHSQFTINARLSRTWGFGERVTGNNNNQRNQGGQNNQPGFGRGAGGPGGGGGGRGGGGGNFGGGRGGGGDSSGQKYTLTAGIVARNILNTVNPAGYESSLLSNRFDVSESLANTGGQGVSANRRMEFNLRFSF